MSTKPTSDMNNFKGIYFNETTDKKNFEFGAHFSYKDMCRRLEKLRQTLSPDRRGEIKDLFDSVNPLCYGNYS